MTGLEILGGGLLLGFISKHDTEGTPKQANVSGIDYAQGVDPSLLALLDAWGYQGTHDIHIAGSESGEPYPGGLRYGAEAESAQSLAYRNGDSKAATLADTPHGRGGALDVYPDGFDFYTPFEQQPDMKQKMSDFGKFAENFGFVWGGRWSKPDHPHVELPSWQSLPYPPKGV